MAELLDWNNYMREKAQNLKSVKHTAEKKHFFRFNIAELGRALQDDVFFPAIAVETIDLALSDAGSDNIRSNTGVAFLVLKKLENKQDFAAAEQAMDECLEIAKDLLGVIHKDKSNNHAVVRNFDFNGCMVEPAPVIFVDCCGYRVEATNNTGAGIYFDASKFDDEIDYSYK